MRQNSKKRRRRRRRRRRGRRRGRDKTGPGVVPSLFMCST